MLSGNWQGQGGAGAAGQYSTVSGPCVPLCHPSQTKVELTPETQEVSSSLPGHREQAGKLGWRWKNLTDSFSTMKRPQEPNVKVARRG